MDSLELVITSRGTIKFNENYVYPTKTKTLKMHQCLMHRYHTIEETGMKNGHGIPTWICIFCHHKVISM